jgi:glucan 1,4-alpha-glucosidase
MRLALPLFAIITWLQTPVVAQQFPQTLYSPDRQIVINISLSLQGEPQYSVRFRKQLVVERSKLGLVSREGDFTKGLQWMATRTSSNDATWQPVWGEEANIRDHYNELVYELKNGNGQRMTIRFRAFNDGLGLRYEFPDEQSQLHFTNEITEFKMTANHTCWWNPLDYDSNEHTYKQTPLSAIDVSWYRKNVEPFNQYLPIQHGVNTPVTMRTNNGTHISIAEADLTDFGALQLKIDPKTFKFSAHVIPTADSTLISVNSLPFNTPWRCILLSPDAAGLLKNRIILNLNDPVALTGDLSWIQPQKYVGLWWEMHVGKSTWDYFGTQDMSSATNRQPSGKHGANTESTKKYLDFAGKHGFSGVLVEGWNDGWEDWFGKMKAEVFDFTKPYPDYNTDELVQFARARNTKIIMHHETSSAVPSYERQMEAGYAYMKQHGMSTVKTGYVGRIQPKGEYHDGQRMVNHYLQVANQTAQHKIMVVMHESVRPSGQHRTYPNWMSCEAARGQEYNAWSSGNPPDHELNLIFTRLLGGPMDYTPGIFRIRANQFDPKKTEQVHTTVAKQLALYVTLYSPVQMAADLPENYEQHLDWLQFIKDVPTDWQETRILSAAVGDYVVTARQQKGSKNWFIGAMTDETPRQKNIQLNFLEPNTTYTATIYEDGPNADWKTNPESVNIRKVKVRKGSTITLKMAASGGAAISIMTAD